MVLAYLKGWFFSWRTTAWLANAYVIIPAILIMFIPESPAWLVSKGRIDEARRSLEWINRYQPKTHDEKVGYIHSHNNLTNITSSTAKNTVRNATRLAHQGQKDKRRRERPLYKQQRWANCTSTTKTNRNQTNSHPSRTILLSRLLRSVRHVILFSHILRGDGSNGESLSSVGFDWFSQVYHVDG